MARRQLTDLAVKAIKPKARYFEVADGTSGLRLAVFPSGAKSWIARYRRPDSGKTAKLTIGKCPAMSLSTARIRVAEASAAVAVGTDPGESKKRAKASAQEAKTSRAADTVELHVKEHLERQRRAAVSAGHWRQARLALEGHAVAAWPGRSVHEITRRDIRELAEEIAAIRGPIAGNRAFEHVRKFFNELVARDVIAASPCTGLRRPTAKETQRSRVLADGEIKAVHDALTAIGSPVAACALMLLYSGQRRTECATMQRSETSDGVWSLPAAKVKNRRAHSVPLSPQMVDLIERQPVLGDFVFSNGGDKPVSKFSNLKIQVDAIAKLEAPWCWHDLRRTVCSGMAKLGVALPTIEKVINHASGSFRGIVGVYQRHDYANEKRNALAAWGREVERIVSGKSAKIVKLRS
jgi:integrase